MANGAALHVPAYAPRVTAAPRAILSPILIILAVAILACPEETSLFIGGLRLTVARIVLLFVLPYALLRFIQQAGTRSYRFVISDALFIPTALWMLLAVCVTEGLDRAIVGCGVTALEFAGAYFAARALLTGPGQALVLAQWVSVLIAIAGYLAPLDTITGHHVIHDVLGSITGYEPTYQVDVRRGLLRSTSTMEHPILLGTACVAGMLLGLRLPIVWRCFVIAGTAIGLGASISSAPVCAIIIGFACLAYRRVTPGFDTRWMWLLGICALLLTALLTLHPAPFGWLIGHTTFEPTSGYYRLLTWHYAGELVLASPVFGIGLTEQWARPDWLLPTVDTEWLRAAMSFGIPGSVLIAACLIGACARRVDSPRVNLSPDERQLGLVLSINTFLIIFIGFTTSFWGTTWILMGLFAGMRAHLGARAALPATAEPWARRVHANP
jgi:hypothetical protein